MEVQTSSNLIKSALIKEIRIKRCFAILLTSVLFLGIFQVFTMPAGALAFQEEVFSIWPAEVGNQAEDAPGGFFYLSTEPGEEQQISVRIVNLTEEYRTIEVSINLATTDNQGGINYWGSDEPADTTLPHNIEDLLIFEPYIVLEPNEETYFWVTVRMPIMPYQGVLAGGLVFRLAEDSFHEEDLIAERRVLAVLLRQDGFVESNIVLEGVSTEVLGGQSVISAHLRNVAANFVGQMRITTTIRDNTGEVVFTNVRHDVDMAPNSSFHHELGLDGLQMSEEMYEVTFLLESGPYDWLLTIPFQGTGTLLEEPELEPEPEPEPVQEEEPVEPLQPEPLDEENLTNILLFLLIIGGIFLITLIVVSIVRSKKSRIDDFEEVHGQILATLMSDEEAKARSTKREVKSISKDKVVSNKESDIEALFMDQEDFEDEDSSDKKQEKVTNQIQEEANFMTKDLEEVASPKAKEIEQKEKELERKVKVLERKAKEIEKKEKTIVAKEKSIEEMAKTIEDKAKTIEDKVKAIEDKVKTIEELEKEVERKEKEQKERAVAKKRKKLPERKKEEWDIEI